MDRVQLFRLLAHKLESKWLYEEKLPHIGHIRGLTINHAFWNIIYTEYGNFRYRDNSRGYIGPRIEPSTVLKELWSELEEAEKTLIMSEILGSHA